MNRLIFEMPLFLVFLFFIPPTVYFCHFRKDRGGRLLAAFSIWKEDSFTPPFSIKRVLGIFSQVLYWIGAVLFIAALAGPMFAAKERIFLSRGMDIMIVIDESLSMAAGDFPPENRFESAKDVVRGFIGRLENDSAGLISFARDAALRIPPTLDYDTLLKRIDDLELIQLGDGTAIGSGIALSCLHLRNSTAVEKVIILLTDGDNNAGEIMPRSAADLAARMGIRIYAIGIGSDGEVPLEYTDPETGITRRGTYISGYNETLLKEISSTTGGRYFAAASPGALTAIFNTIESMEAVEKRVKVNITTVRLYREFIFAGFILILSGFFFRKLVLGEVFL